ncbi:ferric uptake regulator [Candidatus Methanoplasma termitum]|uniref:Ferric uptake regulator n=1 Tax=Candidatus Methanoplasma termitum TaxID=1577791 RepID=A0A0A7LEM3_9ARCH|nr:Fur family transcriptional regulator [Candidatus Methanoplasma termitum]AIZ56777.1 ferric uptake regulator [Candidatus Methanoplasma termitum]MCL2333928.1 transcriptional repressor [Candidatus Methanoplasma sp.]
MQRWTPQLSSTLGIVYETEHFLSAEQIYKKLLQKEENVGIATVYRNLKKLIGLGLISEVTWKDEKYYTRHPFSNAFFICEKCGKMLRIDIPLADQNYLSKEVGLHIKRWKMSFEGVCEECERCI